MANKELDYRLEFEGDTYNINANFSLKAEEADHAELATVADKVEHKLTIHKYHINDSNKTLAETSVDFDGSANEDLYSVSRAGGEFSGPIVVPDRQVSLEKLSGEAEETKNKIVTNYNDVVEIIKQFKTAVLYSVDEGGGITQIDPGQSTINSMPFYYGPASLITGANANEWIRRNDIRYGFYITTSFRTFFIHPTSSESNTITVNALDKITEIHPTGGEAITADEIQSFLNKQDVYDETVTQLGVLEQNVADMNDSSKAGTLAALIAELNKQVTNTTNQATLAYKAYVTLTNQCNGFADGTNIVKKTENAKTVLNTATVWSSVTAGGAPGGSSDAFTTEDAERYSRIFISSGTPGAPGGGLYSRQRLSPGDIWIKLPS